MDARRVEDRGARIGKPVKSRAFHNLTAKDVLPFLPFELLKERKEGMGMLGKISFWRPVKSMRNGIEAPVY